MEDYINIELGSSFLLNSGILGFIRFLESNSAKAGVDYIFDNQSLYVSKNYITDNDISKMYVNTMAKLLGNQTKFFSILAKKNYVISLYEQSTELNGEVQKGLESIYKEFAAMLEKSSFKAGYIICNSYEHIVQMDLTMISDFKKAKDLIEKKELYLKLCEIVEQPEMSNVLIIKDLMYTKINLFFDNTSFFLPANLKLKIEDCYLKDFVTPLINEIKSDKPKKKRCIECDELSTDVKSISFMIDTTDDVARKKSAYWNCKPDAYVCPVCALMYTFVPLGFAFLGQDAVFINNNSSIDGLIKIMSSYRDRTELNTTGSLKSRMYQAFTSDKIDMISNKINNIQVIVRSPKSSHYELSILGKDKIKMLLFSKKHLTNLEKKYIKNGKDFISVYDEVFDNILYNRSQYVLINKLFRMELSNSTSTNYLINILNIELIFRGGNNLDSLKKNVDIAFAVGKEMRYVLTGSVKDKDIDNSLRGFVYKLSNALSVGNRDDFLDTIIRVYSGKGIAIPYIFKETYSSDEMFKAIATGFILGLKYSKYQKEENKEVVNNG